MNGVEERINIMEQLSRRQKYTSNLQRAGAAIQDIKILLSNWREDIDQKELVKDLIGRNILGKKSRRRMSDFILFIFLPRYITGYPQGHWRYLKKLLELNVSIEILYPLLYFYCALNEPLIIDFIDRVLLPRYRKGILDIDSDAVRIFIRDGIAENRINVDWSEAVKKNVAAGLYAALKEFGILEGGRRRKIAPKFIPLPVFVYIAFFIFKEGTAGKEILNHEYWKVFLLNKTEIQHLFMEAHQQKYLRFEEAGDVVRIDFLYGSFEELTDAIIERAN